jgi:hypothetical protein
MLALALCKPTLPSSRAKPPVQFVAVRAPKSRVASTNQSAAGSKKRRNPEHSEY